MGFACIFEALVLREYLELELLPGFVEKLSVSTFISATFFGGPCPADSQFLAMDPFKIAIIQIIDNLTFLKFKLF